MQTLEKPIYDSVLYDIDCTDALDDAEVILTCAAPAVDPASGVTFGTPVVNQAPIRYPVLGRYAPPGKAIQVLVTGGALPVGESFACYPIRLLLATNINPALSVTVCLRLTTGASQCAC